MKFTIFPPRFNLVKSQLVLTATELTSIIECKGREINIDTYRIQVARTERPAVFQDFVKASLNRSELVSLI